MLPARHIVVLRFSAMGDVAMAVPVVKAVLTNHPDLHITFVSNAAHEPLFHNIERCYFFAVFTRGEHKGIFGMLRLFRQLKKLQNFEAVADLHDVLRTKLLLFFSSVAGIPGAVICKGRAAKKELTSKEHKHLRQLPTSHERYAAVFSKLGWAVDLHKGSYLKSTDNIPLTVSASLQSQKRLVGIAPFARHQEKMYPLEKMKLFLRMLSDRDDVQLFFFGAPGLEAEQLESWQQEFTGSVNVAGKISLADELNLISNLSMMVTMDSANMHMASIYGVPVVSIWGATHPYAGFYGWQQDEANIVQAELYCRPCSVFGNKPCFRGDHACMHLISAEMIMQKTRAVLDGNNS